MNSSLNGRHADAATVDVRPSDVRRGAGVRLAAILLTAALAGVPRLALGVDCYREIDPVYYETDVRSLIHATTQAEVDRIREELVTFIWKTPVLPQGLPEVETNVGNPFPDLPQLPNVSRVDMWTARMGEYVSRMFLFLPRNARRELMIFHQGHSDVPSAGLGAQTIGFFLERRYPVLVVHMPMYGPNTAPFTNAPFLHAPMFYNEEPSTSAFRYFLEPVVLAVNYAKQALRYRRVNMIGLSGGGWTTTLAAAVDPRIRRSFPVAGSLPLYLRKPPCLGSGDQEQDDPRLYGIADYVDLYVLGAHGRGRGQLQVLNQFDACCFFGVGFVTYRQVVTDTVDKLRRGKYDLFLDSSHHRHHISPYALDNAIFPFLRHRRVKMPRHGPSAQ